MNMRGQLQKSISSITHELQDNLDIARDLDSKRENLLEFKAFLNDTKDQIMFNPDYDYFNLIEKLEDALEKNKIARILNSSYRRQLKDEIKDINSTIDAIS